MTPAMVDDARSAPERPEDRFDAAAQRFQAAAARAREACHRLGGAPAPERPATAPGPEPEGAAEEPVGPLGAAPLAPRPVPAPPPPVPTGPPGSALLDDAGLDLRPYALEPLDDLLRWRVPLPGGRAVEVTAAPEHADVEDGRHWSEGFGDLYEPIADLGEAAVWEPLSHTLHAHAEGWAVTATVDVTFGSELAEPDLLVIEDVARAALAARPANLPTAPPPRPTGRLRRGRRG